MILNIPHEKLKVKCCQKRKYLFRFKRNDLFWLGRMFKKLKKNQFYKSKLKLCQMYQNTFNFVALNMSCEKLKVKYYQKKRGHSFINKLKRKASHSFWNGRSEFFFKKKRLKKKLCHSRKNISFSLMHCKMIFLKDFNEIKRERILETIWK